MYVPIIEGSNTCQNFRHLLDAHTQVALADPRIRNHLENSEMRKNVGGNVHCPV
jgi:hypothetical protein